MFPRLPLSGLCPWTPLGASVPQTSCYVPQPWRQVDAYGKATCKTALNAKHSILQLFTLHVYGFPLYSSPTHSSWLQQAGMFLLISSSVVCQTINNFEVPHGMSVFYQKVNRTDSVVFMGETEPNRKSKSILQTPSRFYTTYVDNS